MKPLAQMNVIPFIDIMLVLLAIVLITATFVAQGKIPVSLAKTSHADALPAKKTLELTIDREGQLYWNEKKLSLDEFNTKVQQLEPQTPVLLRVDQQAVFQHFVSVIDQLKQRQLENFSIVTQQADN